MGTLILAVNAADTSSLECRVLNVHLIREESENELEMRGKSMIVS